MIQRMHQILNSFSRKVSQAKRARKLNKFITPVNINGNGTNGYVIKSGKNKGKILGHYKIQPRNPF